MPHPRATLGAAQPMNASDAHAALGQLLHQSAQVVEIARQAYGLPFFFRGVDSIDASRVHTDLLGHSVFSNARSVLSDLSEIIKDLVEERRGATVSPKFAGHRSSCDHKGTLLYKPLCHRESDSATSASDSRDIPLK